MIILSPSILAADFSKLGEQIREVEESGAAYLHIDVMDGNFVPAISLGMPVISSIRKVSDIVFDVHLMITDPEKYVDEFVRSGADIITFHAEAVSDPGRLIDRIHAFGKKAGIALKPATPVASVQPYLDQLDMLLVMTVEPGFGGQSYLPESTDRIRQAKSMIEEAGTETLIQVDGGIKQDNVQTVLEAGANVIVAGSNIFHGEIGANIAGFLQQFEAYHSKK